MPTVAPSLRGYSRAWLGLDLLAGLTLAAICVPESMADARLAAMPPVTGLYAFLGGAIGAVLLSRSRQLSIGPDSTIGPMMAVGVGTLVAASSPDYPGRIGLLALLLGVCVIAAGVARLGFLADLLSRPVMSGFLSGVGLVVIVGQLHVVLGVPASGGGVLEALAGLAGQVGSVHVAALAIGLAVAAVVVGGERLEPRFPAALLAVVGSIAAVAVLAPSAADVALVGALPSGLPTPALPAFTLADIGALVPVAVPIFFVILAQTSATSRSFALAGGYPVSVDDDFAAAGLGSAIAGLLGAFAVNGSPTRTGVVAASNGRSQAVNLVAGGVVAVVLLVATGAIASLPEATLGGILIAVGLKLIKWRDLIAVARYSPPEAAIAVMTLLVVAVVGIQAGIYLAIALALLRRTYLSARPHDAVLGRLPGRDGVWLSRRGRPDTEVPPGVAVFRFDAPLFYANAQHFEERVTAVIAAAAQPVHLFVVDAVGIDDLDYTGAQVLGEVDEALKARGVTLAFAHPFGHLGRELSGGSLAARFAGRVFDSVDDAVAGRQPAAA